MTSDDDVQVRNQKLSYLCDILSSIREDVHEYKERKSFKIVRNDLHNDKLFAKPLVFENEHYTIKLFYNDDNYAEHKCKGIINRQDITIQCKPKDVFVALDYANSIVFLRPLFDTIAVDKVDAFMHDMLIAQEAAKELEKIIDEYF